ncbi:MAG: PCP reductase family protein [Nitrospirota bacterium]
MKFVCMNCETFMLFQKVEKPGEGSLGVEFLCPSCKARFSMVTNPGETQMVQALGVKIGGRTTAPEAFELTRGTLKEGAECPVPGAAAMAAPAMTSGAVTSESGAGSCPFSSMVASMGAGGAEQSTALEWSAEALERLAKIPDFVRPTVKMEVEAYARQAGETFVTQAMLDKYKTAPGSLTWSSEASKRLENIPFFIRPMAKKEIERLAREEGRTEVTVEVMDHAKTAFAKFMGG